MAGLLTLRQYLANISEGRKQRLNSIRRLVRELYPTAVESLRYKMPTFEYESGWISVANQKNYVSVYTCMSDHIAGFKKLHPEIKTGGACINFRDRDSIPFDDLKPVVCSALEYRHD